MQADRRLVEHVEDATQVRPQLRRETNPLRLPARESLGGTIQGEVAETDLVHELKPLPDFLENIPRDNAARALECEPLDPLDGAANGERRDLVDGLVENADAAGRFV